MNTSSNQTFSQALQKKNKENNLLSRLLKKISGQENETSIVRYRQIKKSEPKERIISADLFIKNNKAFIPTIAEVKDKYGSYLMAPVQTCSLDLKELSTELKKALYKEKILISPKQRDELLELKKKRKDPLLKILNSSSWRNLAQTSALYSIQPDKEETEWNIYLSEFSKRGAYRKLRNFPIDTPIEELVKFILDDVKKFPHVLKETSEIPKR